MKVYKKEILIFIPKELKDFSVWLNPKNLQAFNKLEIIKLARHILKNKTKPLSVELQKQLGQDLDESDKSKGIFALRVYFYQLLCNDELSLDLRPSRFSYDDGWRFKGENLAFKFNNDLQQALINTYEIYYENQAHGLGQCLDEMGLIVDSWTEEEKQEFEDIFKSHFQQEYKTKQFFKLSDLLNSFSNIFFFIRKRGGTVPSEFSLLGVYLTSLYMTLNNIEEPIDVQNCYEVAKAQSSSDSIN